ncbi:MAG: hypothetical protein CM15mV26_0820 [uncultured marine virus]|nr:MAG: hypothetical protein CM15mV26_0820 [uncultured marine virus]
MPSSSSDITDVTLFVKYIDSGDNKEISFLDDGENLITEESFVYGNTPINAGDTVVNLIDSEASHIGSSLSSIMVYFSSEVLSLTLVPIELY